MNIDIILLLYMMYLTYLITKLEKEIIDIKKENKNGEE